MRPLALGLGPPVLALLIVSAMALAPLKAGAADEPGQPVRASVEGGRVSVFAKGAPVRDIVRALADRTGVEIAAIDAGRLEATVTVEQEPLDRVLERVVRAVIPATNATSVFTYDKDHKLRAVKIVFRGAAGSATAGEDGAAGPSAEAPSASAEASGSVKRLTDEQHRTLFEQLRRAGVPDTLVDLAVEQLAEAGVPLPEILELLTAASEALRGDASTPGDDVENGTAAVVEPLSEVDRQTLTAELRAAGIGEPPLEEGHLLAARQLRSDGVPLPEILELLRAAGLELKIPAGTARAAHDDPATLATVPSLGAEVARTLMQELRQAGVPEGQLDESSLIAAQQLKAAGVAIEEIRENLAAIKSAEEESETNSVPDRQRP